MHLVAHALHGLDPDRVRVPAAVPNVTDLGQVARAWLTAGLASDATLGAPRTWDAATRDGWPATVVEADVGDDDGGVAEVRLVVVVPLVDVVAGLLVAGPPAWLEAHRDAIARVVDDLEVVWDDDVVALAQLGLTP